MVDMEFDTVLDFSSSFPCLGGVFGWLKEKGM